MPHYCYVAASALGLLLPAHISELPAYRSIFALLILALVFYPMFFFRLVACFFAGMLISIAHLSLVIDRQLPTYVEGHDVWLTARVVGLPVHKTDRMRFDVLVENAEMSDATMPGDRALLVGKKVRWSWRHESPPRKKIQPGQVWQLNTRLKRPRSLANPAGFDYQAWLLHKNIMATGYVRPTPANRLVETPPPGIFDRMRAHLDERVFDPRDDALVGILRALLIGDKSRVHQAQWETLNRTGTTHLMAISGLHIGLVAVLSFYLCRRCFALAKARISLNGARIFPGAVSIACSGLYAGIAGFSIPTQRAWLIVVVVNLAYWAGRRCSAFYLVLCAGMVVLAMNPFASTQHGFWLSFGAVFFLLVFFACKYPGKRRFIALVQAQCVLFFAMTAILAALGIPFSLSSPVANIIAVPVMSLVIIPLLFITALLCDVSAVLSGFLFDVCLFVLRLLWGFLRWLSEFNAVSDTHLPSASLILLAIVAVLLLLSPRQLNARMMGAGLLLVVFFYREPQLENTKIVVLDVGQGLSVVVQTRHHAVVYDVGARYSEDYDIGSHVLAPFLRSENIHRLSLVAISHGDNDHAGGLEGLAKSVPFDSLAYNSALSYGDRQRSCVAGDTWQFDDVTLEVLWPQTSMRQGESRNNASCVILLKTHDFQMLLPGDIDKSVEYDLIEGGELPRHIDVLVAPHHGSRTSSSQPFIEHLSPAHVIFSAGYKNRYRHPAASVVERFSGISAIRWNTASDGAIVIRAGDGDPVITSERRGNPKPWFAHGDKYWP